ncbi:MAG: hypothetical protein GC168_04480 [Candidatus Hydrogenedens sp.]|nr:hypothetical protein [Candidatus Hydrogenedens sp.]
MLPITAALVSTLILWSASGAKPAEAAPPSDTGARTVIPAPLAPPPPPGALAPLHPGPAPDPRPESSEPEANLSPVLARHAQSSDPELRMRAIEALEGMPAATALSKLIPFLEDSNEEVRARAVSALSTQPDDALAEAIMETLAGGAPESWYGWESPLPQLGTKLGAYFIGVLDDTERSATDRAWAVYCLGRMRVTEAYERLIFNLHDGPTEVAYACVEALYWLDDPRAEDEWLRLSADTDPWVQWYVVSALSRIQSDRTLNTLFGFASGQLFAPQSIQELALDGISRWPLAQSVPLLIDVLRFNRAMEEPTIAMLIAVTGENLGTSAVNWIDGYEQYMAELAAAEAAAAAAYEGAMDEPVPPAGSDLTNTVDFVPPDF